MFDALGECNRRASTKSNEIDALTASSSHGHRERLRQRFLRSGFDGFADHEVVELLLTLAIPQKDVKQPAKALLAKFGSLRGILDAPSDAVSAIKGLGNASCLWIHERCSS